MDLPQSFRHIRVSENEFRSSIANYEDIQKWIKEYSLATRTSWVVKYHKPPSKGVIFAANKIFICHHTDHRRKAMPEGRRGKIKNLKCQAEIIIKIKPNIPRIRNADEYARGGLLGIIILKNKHSHEIDAAEILSCLRPTEELKTLYFEYFNSGLGITDAIHHHEAKLSLKYGNSSAELANAQQNPKYDTVQKWHATWLLQNHGPRFGEGVIEKFSEEKQNIPLQKNPPGSIPSVSTEEADIKTKLSLANSILKEWVSLAESDPNFIREFRKLDNAKLFFKSFNVTNRPFRRGIIPVQSTAISRRRTGVTKGKKRLSLCKKPLESSNGID